MKDSGPGEGVRPPVFNAPAMLNEGDAQCL